MNNKHFTIMRQHHTIVQKYHSEYVYRLLATLPTRLKHGRVEIQLPHHTRFTTLESRNTYLFIIAHMYTDTDIRGYNELTYSDYIHSIATFASVYISHFIPASLEKEIHGRCVYIASPLALFPSLEYERVLWGVSQWFPACVMSPRILYDSNRSWLQRFPRDSECVEIALFLTFDDMSIGRGGYDEYLTFHERAIPCYVYTGGRLVPLTSVERLDGDSWVHYARVVCETGGDCEGES